MLAGTPPIGGMHDAFPSMGEVVETMTLRAGYNTTLVILGTTLLGLAAGVVGVFTLLRKRALTTDALSHATLPGVALAFLGASALGVQGRTLPILLVGAAVTGLLGVLCIHAILRYSRLHEDAAIGIVLSVFFGAGVVGMSYIQKNAPSGSAGLNAFIYGQAATMLPRDVVLMGAIAGVAMIAASLLFKEFTLVCFNESFARVDGWRVGLIDLLMMALVVLVTVAGLQAVGLILVVAMLIIPPVAARFWTDRLWMLVVIAGLFGAASGYLGSVVSALLPRKPAGAVIVLTAGALFVIGLVAAPARGVVATMWRRFALRIRIAGDHLLELAHELRTRMLAMDAVDRLARSRGWSPLFRWVLVRSLIRDGMIDGVGSDGIVLTGAGLARGARVARNHALWEQYLISHADIAPSHVDWSVDQVEHVLSDDLVRELEGALASRGVPIPDRQGGMP